MKTMKTPIATIIITLCITLPVRGTDFNHDGMADYLLFNPTTRQTAVWYLNNTAFVSGTFGPSVRPGWNLIAEADFNFDSHPDYVLSNPSTRQTAIWYLRGNMTISSGRYGPTLPAHWQLAAVADFNGDGHPDFALFNPLTHQTAIWFLINGAYSQGAYGPRIPPGWFLVDAQDFNLDFKPDFLLYQTSTRQTAVWYLSGSSLIGGAYGPMIVSGYALVGSGDFNADLHPDYVLDPPALPATWNMGGSGGVEFLYGVFGHPIPTAWKLATEEAKPCGFSFVPGELHIGIAGGAFTVTVGSNRQTCAWQATTDRPDFIHLITTSGTGNGTITFSVSPNNGSDTQEREGSITVGEGDSEAECSIIQLGTEVDIDGEWQGTLTGALHPGCNANCSYNQTTNFDVHITTGIDGTTISGPATWDGLPCWDCDSCALLEVDNSAGSIDGAVVTTTAQFSYSGTYSGNACDGASTGFTITAVITGNTMTGTTSLGQTMTLHKIE